MNLTVVANRLPAERHGDAWRISPGGLVAALRPVLGEQGGTWVGWAGEPDLQLDPVVQDGIRLLPVAITAEEIRDYYEGFANGTLWPLFHDKVRPPAFHRHWWRAYIRVNQRFADTVARSAPEGGAVWVHDYHLALLPRLLRDRRPDLRIGFFLHIPFPPLALFAQLPWRMDLLQGLLGADALGFQTADGAGHFRAAARRIAGADLRDGLLTWEGRQVKAEAHPISIDAGGFAAEAAAPAVERRVGELRALLGGRAILMGVDRLDYTKGIRARLRAFETLLERRPELVERVVFVQVAVPSRENITQYAAMREAVEQMTGRINGSYARFGQLPVHYFYDSLEREELVAHYRAADVMVVTPPRDGMNLVAKEYVACRVHDDGVLVLSEFAGASHELLGALEVNPWDLDGMAAAYEQALEMPREEQAERIRPMREYLLEHDVFAWAREALEAFDAG